jgi:hypothetical protein
MSSEMRESDRPNYERASIIQVELNTRRSLKSQHSRQLRAAYPAASLQAKAADHLRAIAHVSPNLLHFIRRYVVHMTQHY